jgi:hypothetical protein
MSRTAISQRRINIYLVTKRPSVKLKKSLNHQAGTLKKIRRDSSFEILKRQLRALNLRSNYPYEQAQKLRDNCGCQSGSGKHACEDLGRKILANE